MKLKRLPALSHPCLRGLVPQSWSGLVNVYYIMGFRPSYFTCIAHLYLYYTLLVPHTYASYIRAWCIFSHYEIQYNLSVFLIWYQSHCSDLFLAVLSVLVLLHSQHCFRYHNSRCSLSPLKLWRLPVVVLGFRTCSRCRWGVQHRTFLEISLCSSWTDLPGCESLAVIRDFTRRHARLEVSASETHAPHALSSVPADVTRDIISATSALAALASTHLLTVDLWLTVDRWLFSSVDFCSPGSPYPVFHVDFIFVFCFCILCL